MIQIMIKISSQSEVLQTSFIFLFRYTVSILTIWHKELACKYNLPA